MGHVPDRIASYDLHLHTYWSYDGLPAPQAYFRRAHELGMRCIAFTEHHVMDGFEEAATTAEAYPDVRWIPAAEFTVRTPIRTVDAVCYGLPLEDTPALKRIRTHYHEWQHAYGDAICRGMQRLGFDYTESHRREALESYRPVHVLAVQGATHVKNQIQRDYFIQRGFVTSEQEYRALLGRISEMDLLPAHVGVEEVAGAVHEAGGVIAIAHPFRYFQGTDRALMDRFREECALDGIECAHPSVPPEAGEFYRAYCVEHGLLSVGGSDCHTQDHVGGLFGRHLGADEWLDELLERLDG